MGKNKMNFRQLQVAIFFVVLFTVILNYQNCAPVKFENAPATPANVAATPICQPFTNGTGMGTAQNGILSSITYLPPTSTVISQSTPALSTASFVAGQPDVQVISNPVYLNQFSVFTQNFSLGFQLASGTKVTDLSGNELVQYFSLHSSGFIGLAENSTLGATAPGAYQFAVMSDDGAVFSLGDGKGNFAPLINNDGNHSNRFACATTTVNLTSSNLIPFKLDYYQGPPQSISLMLFWRPVNPSNPSTMADPLCPSPSYATTEGDTYFFGINSTTGLPVATTEYYDSTPNATTGILNRGWQVVSAGNFFLANGTTNPCN